MLKSYLTENCWCKRIQDRAGHQPSVRRAGILPLLQAPAGISSQSAEELRRNLMQVDSPVGPLMTAGRLECFDLYAFAFELVDHGKTIGPRNVGLAPSPPKQLQLCIVFGNLRRFTLIEGLAVIF